MFHFTLLLILAKTGWAGHMQTVLLCLRWWVSVFFAFSRWLRMWRLLWVLSGLYISTFMSVLSSIFFFHYILLFMLLQLSQFFSFWLPQVIPTPLFMSMCHVYTFFGYSISCTVLYIPMAILYLPICTSQSPHLFAHSPTPPPNCFYIQFVIHSFDLLLFLK